jgi:peroxin-5
MSFLSGGAECSTSGNPLSQFQKHVQDDKTLQRDRLVSRGPGGQMNGFRSQNVGGSQDEVPTLSQRLTTVKVLTTPSADDEWLP